MTDKAPNTATDTSIQRAGVLNPRLIASAALSLALATAMLGCSDSSSTDEAQDTHSNASTHDHDAGESHSDDHGDDHADDSASTQTSPDVYPDILGQITMLPVAGDPKSTLKIHHEQIPNFKTKEGKVHVNAAGIAGMASMTMPFPPAQGLDLSELSVGDKVKFTFQVNWGGSGGPAWETTKIEKIDPSTEIDFNNFLDDAKEELEDAGKDVMDKVKDGAHDMMNHDGP